MTYSTFFREEFSGLDLHDKRLVERAISIGNRLLSVPGSCIQSLFDCHNAARCAYDFFSNPKVECSSIFSVHQDKSTQRIVDDHTDTLYLLQDSTYYNYTWHTAKLDLCRIGKQGRFTQLGVIQHSTLCLNGDGLPLGLLELEFLGHETQDACAAIRGRSESLFSQRWRRFTLQSLSRLSQCEKKKIFLCDREADFFEHLYDLSHASCDYVIRSKWDRPIGDWYRKPDSKLSLLLEKTDSLGSLQLFVTDPHTHEERITTVTLSRFVRLSP